MNEYLAGLMMTYLFVEIRSCTLGVAHHVAHLTDIGGYNMSRGNGEGSVYREVKPGRDEAPDRIRWIAQVRIEGKKHRRIAPTEAKAKKALREMQATIATGDTVGHGNTTVGQLLAEWRKNALPARELSERTITVYEWCTDVLTESIGKHRADRLTPEQVEAAFTNLVEHGRGGNGKPVSRASLIKIRSVLGKALDWGVRRGHVARNVARAVELPVAARRTELGRSLTVEQARILMGTAAAHRLHALLRIMLMLGLRPGEATGLTWYDIDLDAGIVHVRRSLKLERGNLVVTDALKTTRSRRSLATPPDVIDALRRHRTQQAAERLAMGRLWSNPDDLVFTTTTGSPIEPNNLRHQFARVTESAGLGRWHPHELRHSTASLLSARGVPLERIADVLGHDGTRMTALVYRHAVAPTIDDALIMAEVLA